MLNKHRNKFGIWTFNKDSGLTAEDNDGFILCNIPYCDILEDLYADYWLNRVRNSTWADYNDYNNLQFAFDYIRNNNL